MSHTLHELETFKCSSYSELEMLYGLITNEMEELSKQSKAHQLENANYNPSIETKIRLYVAMKNRIGIAMKEIEEGWREKSG